MTQLATGLVLTALPLGDFSPEDWGSVKSAFERSRVVPLTQAWLKEPDPLFKPTFVRVGLGRRELWVYAEIEDEFAHNPGKGGWETFFDRGDVFEIFLQPLNQEPYFELHVGPENQRMLLRIPSGVEFSSPPSDAPRVWMKECKLFQSWSRVTPGSGLWQVLVRIPFSLVVEKGGSEEAWLFSFSRYDYLDGKSKPVLSSSSPHQKPGFHRRQEWGRLLLGSAKRSGK